LEEESAESAESAAANSCANMYASMMVEVGDEVASTDLDDLDDHDRDHDHDHDLDDDGASTSVEDEEEEEMEGYAFPIGPLPQQVTNDLKSLDEMVSLWNAPSCFTRILNNILYE